VDINRIGGSIGKSLGRCIARVVVIVLPQDYVDMGIQVNAIAPGLFKTNLGADSFTGLSYDSVAEKIFKNAGKEMPTGRIGVTDEIKGTALFLASRAPDYIIGHITVID